ncbi:MAG: hypothetical protein MRY21_02930 [Simkaniaceae bacterium]|nr:hypothetical protein [Simkaniaceae bacterium]
MNKLDLDTAFDRLISAPLDLDEAFDRLIAESSTPPPPLPVKFTLTRPQITPGVTAIRSGWFDISLFGNIHFPSFKSSELLADQLDRFCHLNREVLKETPRAQVFGELVERIKVLKEAIIPGQCKFTTLIVKGFADRPLHLYRQYDALTVQSGEPDYFKAIAMNQSAEDVDAYVVWLKGQYFGRTSLTHEGERIFKHYKAHLLCLDKEGKCYLPQAVAREILKAFPIESTDALVDRVKDLLIGRYKVLYPKDES